MYKVTYLMPSTCVYILKKNGKAKRIRGGEAFFVKTEEEAQIYKDQPERFKVTRVTTPESKVKKEKKKEDEK